MEIYVVTSGEYSDYHIDAVFTDRSKAEMYCAVHNGDVSMYWAGHEYQVEVYETTDDTIEGDVDMQYQFEIFNDMTEPPKEYENIFEMSPKNENRIIEKRCFGEYIIYAIVYLTKNDPDLAFKIGKDMIAKYKAEQAGL